MQTAKRPITFITHSILLAVLLMMMTLTVHAAGVNWRSYSNDIFKQAKQENKEILLYGYTKQCPYCARMNHYTFTSNSVADAINKKYIAVKIDTGNETALADKYGMYIVPTILILNAQGGVLNSIYGYQEPSELLRKI